ncbi:hypothetical protein [Maribellus comscasis]|uniref:hypothetical protein n=1 Tax=Maribellus comscasis TaxID=2681766 RepID=UPI001C2CE4E6|nr:hypothetical protein [Maribellus comscasis]
MKICPGLAKALISGIKTDLNPGAQNEQVSLGHQFNIPPFFLSLDYAYKTGNTRIYSGDGFENVSR